MDFLTAAETSGSVEDLVGAFEAFLKAWGSAHYALLRLPVTQETTLFRVLCEHLPERWIEFYMERGYHLIDPVLRHLNSAQSFYCFAEADRAFEKDTHRRGIERLAVDRKRFGVADGHIFPVYGRLGLVGAVIIITGRLEARAAMMHLLHAAVNRLFWRFVNLSGEDFARLPSGPVVGMTRREKEVLALLAEGLTSNEIARELSISNHTVDWYVNGLQDKLEARNRQHAVSLGFRRGMLV